MPIKTHILKKRFNDGVNKYSQYAYYLRVFCIYARKSTLSLDFSSEACYNKIKSVEI